MQGNQICFLFGTVA